MIDALADRRAIKDRLLEAAFLHAAFDGWSRRTLVNAAADIDLDPAVARRLFPRGGDSLLAWLDNWADRRMQEAVAEQDLQRLPVRRRIALLVRSRLELMTPYREAIRRAALARGMPGNVMGAGRALWQTVDLMWRLAGLGGEPRQGFTYYSRRASLAGVLATSFLYWLDDHSPDCADSWAFVDRRIEDVMRFGRARAGMERWSGWLTGRGGAPAASR